MCQKFFNFQIHLIAQHCMINADLLPAPYGTCILCYTTLSTFPHPLFVGEQLALGWLNTRHGQPYEELERRKERKNLQRDGWVGFLAFIFLVLWPTTSYKVLL